MDKICVLVIGSLLLLLNGAMCTKSYNGDQASDYHYGGVQSAMPIAQASNGYEMYGSSYGSSYGSEDEDGGDHEEGDDDHYSAKDYGGHAFDAAIHSHHSVSSYPVHSTGHAKTTHVNVPPGVAPIVVTLNSKSSPIIPKHKHIGAHGSYHKSHSSDKPHVNIHTVYKPVYNELNEIVIPRQRHIQKIMKVQKGYKTIVHTGKHYGKYGKGHYYG